MTWTKKGSIARGCPQRQDVRDGPGLQRSGSLTDFSCEEQHLEFICKQLGATELSDRRRGQNLLRKQLVPNWGRKEEWRRKACRKEWSKCEPRPQKKRKDQTANAVIPKRLSICRPQTFFGPQKAICWVCCRYVEIKIFRFKKNVDAQIRVLKKVTAGDAELPEDRKSNSFPRGKKGEAYS